MVNSRYAMTTICNVLMNLTVLEPQFVNDTPIFFHILKFIMNSLPTLDNNGKYHRFLVTLVIILGGRGYRNLILNFSFVATTKLNIYSKINLLFQMISCYTAIFRSLGCWSWSIIPVDRRVQISAYAGLFKQLSGNISILLIVNSWQAKLGFYETRFHE